ncbi:E3 ubiquitin-protein ligase NHLRC1-like [Scleropages formosus]|uniref:RING-type E3 ubiquitin transferase n=1 Tax=Scleropages formosus TaxID=113540 RepID=A0A8C9QNR2_SCLFO|nr:E3 ubiquitin-protein ligase NHLRC1 [Scleropages formosus]XP_029115964.1 E3 ubiquitin-protein ligase NHLRC1 [Scleropages formosus]XP_029115965.1 E3 ubiquitin-protein ligase NHLRC1 [Scleropages formosus]XP_029115966.1 E3 ubiquitin-protein ligase NHLRC1 [Scleropages formosus]XP_029115967.1 E3 ubiquitin-protein ligase NHLRC1 [Scleropages formosus]
MSLVRSPPGCRRLGAEAVLSDIKVNLLECKVCFETFCGQQGQRRPRMLPCGHVLCAQCLSVLSQPLLSRLECPFCRRLYAVANVSDCLPLSELSELLLRGTPGPLCGRGTSSCAGGLATGSLHLRFAFGGWGKLLNPTAIAVFPSSGALTIVHDGDNRVVVFSPKGKRLHGFGQRGCTPAEICHPLGVAVAPSGHVVVTDAGDCAVKVFTSRGRSVVMIRDSFQLPWGVVVDERGHILVTDARAGTLSEIVVDFARSVTVLNRVALAELQCPRAVACCPVTGNVVIVEHAEGLVDKQRGSRSDHLRLFSKELTLLSQIDSFGLSLVSPVRFSASAVAFDRCGDVIVADVEQGVIWSLGKLNNSPVLTALISHGLVFPVGLVATAQNTLIVLDSGDHAVKIYTANSDVTRNEQ